MKVVVTGSEGFIGKHVVRALGAAGHTPVAFDVVLGNDIRNPGTPFQNIKIDALIHLAAMANPRLCDADPSAAFDVNVNGTAQILRWALESGARKVVFASSAHVYGISPRYLPTPETHPLYLQNTYTMTKILGEQLCALYHENHGLSYTTLRLYNAYGPGQGAGYFIPDMMAKAKAGAISLSGGNTTKDFVYITDVAKAFVLALATDFVGPINIGTGIEVRLDSIANGIAQAFGASFESADTPDATRMQADNRRAASVLEWRPTVAILETEEGLNDCIEFAKTGAVLLRS